MMAHEMHIMHDFSPEIIPFKLLYVTRSEYDKGWHSLPHMHHFTELFYIVRGKGSFLLHNREIPVKQNDLVIINPNVEHTEMSNELDSLEYIALGIEGIAFTLPDSEQPEASLFTYQGERDEVLFYLDRILYEIQHHVEGYEIVCRNIIEILIVKLKRAKNISVEAHQSQNLSHAVALVKQYIDQNYQHPITLDDLSDVGSINKYYLVHKFKEDLQTSPIKYLNQVRVDRAKDLLETSDYTIAAISNFSGFSSQSFFSQVFRRETNQTPSEYRKQAQKTSDQNNIKKTTTPKPTKVDYI